MYRVSCKWCLFEVCVFGYSFVKLCVYIIRSNIVCMLFTFSQIVFLTVVNTMCLYYFVHNIYIYIYIYIYKNIMQIMHFHLYHVYIMYKL